MELTLSFAEIHNYICDSYHKDISLDYVSEKEFTLTLKQHIFVKEVTIPVNLRIEEVTPRNVIVVYSGGLPVDMLISGALTFLKSRLHDFMTFITVEDKRRIIIHLSSIEKLRSLLSKLELQDIIIDRKAIKFIASIPSEITTTLDEIFKTSNL